MAKPSDDPTWATDANYAADGDSWSSTPTRVDPGTSRQDEGAEPDTFPAQWFNFIVGVQGDHIAYINAVLEGSDTIPAVTETLLVGPADFRKLPLSGDEGSKWRRETALTVRRLWQTDGSTSGAARLIASLKGKLPHGAVITRMRALVEAATAGINDVTVILRSHDGFDLTDPPPTSVEASSVQASSLISLGSSAAAAAVLDSGAVSITIDSAKGYELEVKSGTGTGVDYFGWVHIEYTNPGPRHPG